MSNKKIIEKELLPFETLDELDVELNRRLNHLIILLENSKLDSKQAGSISHRVDAALKRGSVRTSISAYQTLDRSQDSRMDMLDSLGILLNENPIDSKQTKQLFLRDRFKKIIQFVISLVVITLGLAMIILPAPREFEMFTIFHFTVQDGVTLMDLISLLILLCGVYLLVDSLLKQRSQPDYK